MPTFLFTVDRVSAILDYVRPFPGAPTTIRGVHSGALLELRRPDGTVLESRIHSIPILDPYDPDRPTQIALKGVASEDVPLGTEIWLRDENMG